MRIWKIYKKIIQLNEKSKNDFRYIHLNNKKKKILLNYIENMITSDEVFVSQKELDYMKKFEESEEFLDKYIISIQDKILRYF